MRERKQHDQEDIDRAFAMCFDGQFGRIVLDALRDFCWVKASTFNIDSRVHAFREGERNVYLYIMKRIARANDETKRPGMAQES